MAGRRAWTSSPRSRVSLGHAPRPTIPGTATSGRSHESALDWPPGCDACRDIDSTGSAPRGSAPRKRDNRESATGGPHRAPGPHAFEGGGVEREARGSALLVEAIEAPFLEIEELRALVAEGRERGYLTFEEIAACLEEVEVTKEQVRDLHAAPRWTAASRSSSDGRARAPPDGRDAAARRRRTAPQEARDRPDGRAEPRLAAALPALDRPRGPAHRRRGGRRSPSASSAATWSPSSR